MTITQRVIAINRRIYNNEKRKRIIYRHCPPFHGTSDRIVWKKSQSLPFYFIRTSIKHLAWKSHDYVYAALYVFLRYTCVGALINAWLARLQQQNN